MKPGHTAQRGPESTAKPQRHPQPQARPEPSAETQGRLEPPAETPRLLTAHFTAWLTAATVSAVGEGILYFAIGWTATGFGAGAAGLMLTLVVLPRTVLMLIGGAVGDRWGLRRTLVGSTAASCVVLAGYLAASASPLSQEILMALLAFGIGVVSAFSLPASGAFPRLFASDEALPRAMSLTGSMLQVARLVGPPLGGLVVGILGMTGAVTSDLVGFTVLLLVLMWIRPPYEHVTEGDSTSGLAKIRQGLSAARQTPGVLVLLGAVALVAGSLIPTLSLCVPLAARERGWSASATGLIEGAWIVGTLSVSLLVARLGARQRPAVPLVAGPVLAGAGVTVIAAAPTPGVAMTGAVVMGVGTATFTAHFFPLYVLNTPAGMLARFQALLGVAQAAPMLVGNSMLAAIASERGAASAMAAAAALSALAGSLVLASPVLRRAKGPGADTAAM